MATYEVTGPNGEVFEIEGPDDADPSGVIAQLSGHQPRDLKAENPAEYDPESAAYKAKYGATGTTTENLLAGAGKAFVDLGRGVGQLVGAVSNDDVAESRKLDADLMETKAGKVGNIVGNVAATVPALAIPGANTVAGAGVIGAGLGFLQPSESKTERLTNTAVGGAVGAAAQGIGGKVAQYAQKRLADRTAKAATEEAQNAVRDATLKEARKAGYVVPPSTTNPTVTNRVAESISGKAATQQAAAVRNQRVTNRLVREELGMPSGAPITKQSLAAIRKQAGVVYNAIGRSGRITADDAYLDDLAGIAKSIDDVARDFPDANVGANEQIDKLVNSLLRDDFDASSAIAYMKQLRADATGNLSFAASSDPSKKALGLAQRDAAGALEDMVIRHLRSTGKESLANSFDKARTLIAKTYSVEGALNGGTGNVVATQLGTQLKRGKPLTGKLELAARFGQAFPKAAAEIKDSPGVSAVDALIGGVGGTTINPALFALPVGRIAARKAVLSSAGQALASPNYAPGVAGTVGLQALKQGKRVALPAATYAAQQ